MRTRNLQTLNLSNNKIAGDGGFALSIVIKENNFIKKINLGMNKIDDANGARIIKALIYNNNLEELDLSNNKLGDLTTVALDLSLKNNSTLKVLDFSYNANFFFTDESVENINNHPSLIKFDVNFTRIPIEECHKLEEILVKKEIRIMRDNMKSK
jgi:Leucine-rich repeat (LRR) protein